MRYEIRYNPAHTLFDLTLHPDDGPAVLIGAALSIGCARRAGERAAQVAYGAGSLAAGLHSGRRVLARLGGTPHTPIALRGRPWPAAVRRHQAQRHALALAGTPVAL